MNLTPAELAERLKTSPGTLANWRVMGKGPKWWKPSPKKVLYPLVDVESWEAAKKSAT